MNYWLIKSEPSKYSWSQLLIDKITTWDGVRNYAARNNLRKMKKNEKVLFYHSNEGVEVVGIAKVVKEGYPDSTVDNDTWVAVDFSPVKKLKRSVSLAQIKTDSRLADMALIKLSRLSVQPVKEEEWKVIMELAGEK